MVKLQTLFFFVLISFFLYACTTATATPMLEPWKLVAVGDSIPLTNPASCPGCTSFIVRYAASIQAATGHPVTVLNLSELGGVRIDDLLLKVQDDSFRRNALASADIIVVGISFNDIAWLIDDDPCDGPATGMPDWSKFNTTCAAAAAEVFRAVRESLRRDCLPAGREADHLPDDQQVQ